MLPSSCTVLIAAQALLPALTHRLGSSDRELVAFADHDALRALESITTRRPALVALERDFAATPRGAALINRIKADPALVHSEVRIVAQDVVAPPVPSEVVEGVTAVTPHVAIDQTGTRRVPRVVLAGQIDATIDGNSATLVDLATLGAQVVSSTVLKPNQRVRLTLSDGKTTIRASGTIAWARFEIPPGSGPRYRAGIEFVNPDIAAIDGFCTMHRK